MAQINERQIVCPHNSASVEPENVSIFRIYGEPNSELLYVKVPKIDNIVRIFTIRGMINYNNCDDTIIDAAHLYANGPFMIVVNYAKKRLQEINLTIGELKY